MGGRTAFVLRSGLASRAGPWARERCEHRGQRAEMWTSGLFYGPRAVALNGEGLAAETIETSSSPGRTGGSLRRTSRHAQGVMCGSTTGRVS